jgi:hypothetical protein
MSLINGLNTIITNIRYLQEINHVYLFHKQEARRAAEKAYDVGKVDERVNRAVSAANRAANAARVAAVKAVQKQMHHHVNNEGFQIPIM